MAKKWQLMPVLSPDLAERLPEYNRVILQLLFNRHLTEKQQIDLFFDSSRSELSDPFLFKNMAAAVELIIKHIKEQSLIIVYGDYDADGVTAAAILTEVLKTFKAWAGVYLPGRTSEGYGLNKKAIDELKAAGAKLIITVDNGIRNRAEVEYAKQAGLEIVLTDHHEPPASRADWPDCLIINPKAEDYPFRNFAGAGVAFKLAQALVEKSKLADDIKKKLIEKIYDLVAVGTVADMVSLTGENRILVSRGLEVINSGKRPGLTELIKTAQLNGSLHKKINALNIGWQISPRLNSAGRMEHANTAYELLVTDDQAEAKSLAIRLNEKNQQRQKITEEIVTDCHRQIEKRGKEDRLLVACSPNLGGESEESWPDGVVGLVAGRLCEAYGRPVLVITKVNNEIKGSGRSIDEFNIMPAIEQCAEYLKKFGGHAGACGFTLKNRESLDKFFEKMKRLASEALAGLEMSEKITAEAEVELSEIDEKLLDELEKFEPFGEDNERPKFLTSGLQILDKTTMGAAGQHVKFRFGSIWAVAFSRAEELKDFKIGDKVDAVYYLEFNEFNGRRSAQMKLVDMKKAD